MAGIFKAYDIRGIYGDTLTEALAEKIGRAFATFLGCRKVVVGRDMRPHSTPLFDALARGLTRQGARVIDLGLCSTPMSYFANGSLEADAGIMITASHNPGPWNGFKICRKQAVPISGDTGIRDIEKIVETGAFAPDADRPGGIESHDISEAYAAHIRRFADLARPVRIAADFANAMGIVEARALEGLLEIDPLFDSLDGSFPNHEANPLDHETLEALCERVRGGGYDFGVAFDGDADRAGFVDERGKIVPMDLITALIAKSLLRTNKGSAIFYDLRSSWAVREVIEEGGGIPKMSRVGHAFIKQQMREADAVFAGELSGHYYFKDNFFTESAALAVLYVANLVSRAGVPLSELIRPMRRYYASGEINSTVKDSRAVLERLEKEYSNGRVFHLDGLSVEFEDAWFNVRSSNTEPLIRLNLEARTRERMESLR
ncbi:MAG: phosphomannomutase/phosphoglucomutase, partial [Kiritimatiellia bacterium]|nr:phosphomannomutase/phosphoglucomutase [Kiritimatiellia bacterium]